jgi:hypothetical protein
LAAQCKKQQVNKVKGQLGFPLKAKSPSGATAGGILPKKWSHFFAKNSTRKRAKYVSTLVLSESRRGAGGQAERTREPEIDYASARIRPSGLLTKIELPQPEFAQAKGETEQRDK